MLAAAGTTGGRRAGEFVKGGPEANRFMTRELVESSSANSELYSSEWERNSWRAAPLELVLRNSR